MRRRALLIAACGIVFACDNEVSEPIVLNPPTPPFFNLAGLVRDSAGLPVQEAGAEITTGPFRFRQSISNAAGIFSFNGVSGQMTVRVRKNGFHGYQQDITVVADQIIEVTLTKIDPVELPLGTTIHARVGAADPPCDPVFWDSTAPCRRFGLAAPATGTLAVKVTWRGGSQLDAALMAPDGTYLAFSSPAGDEAVSVDAVLEAGKRYELRVHSYYAAQQFDVRADLTPH